MKQTFIYDLPTRVFHWLFALFFVVAFTIGTIVDDDSTLFSYHMMAGILLCAVVILRLVWGIFGSKYARFTGFSLHPKELGRYFKAVLTGERFKWPGHNPASSWAAIAMMALALGLGVTGYLMTIGQGGEDLHELFANAFLVVVLLHLAGLALHTLRHRDALWTSMFSGRKREIPEERVPVRSYRSVGILFLVITVWFSTYLARNFDSITQNLDIFGARFHLAEAEDDEHGQRTEKDRHGSRKKHGDHDGDSD